MNTKQLLKRSVDLSRESLDSGGFPAGAVVVTKDGNIYESGKSVAWSHGELQAIDAALEVESGPLDGAVMYASMQSCIMCSTKAYWAGIRKVYYIVPKSDVNSEFCYSGRHDIPEVTDKYHEEVKFIQDVTYLDEALGLYKQWENQILGE